MKVEQISVFLENSPGRLQKAVRALRAAGVQVKALCLADTGDFGVLRFIPSDIVAARRVVMERQWPARVDEVVAVDVEGEPESLAHALEPLAAEGINVEYMYSFTCPVSGRPTMIFRFSDNDRALGVLAREHVSVLEPTAFAGPELSH